MRIFSKIPHLTMLSFMLAGSAFLFAGPIATARGDVQIFSLRNGDTLRGELLNPEQKPRMSYRIKTDSGAVLTLDNKEVVDVEHPTEALSHYRAHAPLMPDSIEKHLEMAKWCRERSLTEYGERHLKRILELDPDHEEAHQLLGHIRKEGQWTTQEQELTRRGYVRYKGRWRLPQEVALAEQEEAYDRKVGEFRMKLKKLRKALKGNNSSQAVSAIVSVKDPVAIEPLTEELREESNDSVRLLYLRALKNIGTTRAMGEIARWSVEEPIGDIRLSCIEMLQGDPAATRFYMNYLDSPRNGTVNLAGYALGQLGDKTAIPALINALVTEHQIVLEKGSDQTQAGFDNRGGGGLSMGKTTKVIDRQFQNRAVLEALVELADGPNFGFDESRWQSWWRNQRRIGYFNARRGGHSLDAE
jgi:hypothetical protein